jgi:transposase
MQAITTIGLDIAKSVFQVHGVDAVGQVIIRRQLKRRYVLAFFQKLPPCLIGIEACASSHHWSRELKALGHTVRLMPPAKKCCSANGRSSHLASFAAPQYFRSQFGA